MSVKITDSVTALKAVQTRMERIGLTATSLVPLAAKYGVPRSSVMEFCAGKRPKFNLEYFLAICQAVGLDLSADVSK